MQCSDVGPSCNTALQPEAKCVLYAAILALSQCEAHVRRASKSRRAAHSAVESQYASASLRCTRTVGGSLNDAGTLAEPDVCAVMLVNLRAD